jgi:hypothetical protein
VTTTLALTIVLAQIQPAPVDRAALARDALDVLGTKCVQCHGSNLPHPRASFGYVNDLRKLVQSGKYVAPGKLEESEIWKQIKDDDMPPDGAARGPLTPDEKERIRAWIEAGAPTLEPEVGGPPDQIETSGAAPPTPETTSERSPLDRAIVLLGRMHVLAVHYPVAMLTGAAGAEVWAALRKQATISTTTRVLLWIGSVSALGAAVLGWIHAGGGAIESPLTITGTHRWFGTLAAAASLGVAIGAQRVANRGSAPGGMRWAIVALGALVAGAAHFGGLLTHGAEFFRP